MQCGLPLKHTWSVSDLWGQGPFIILWLTLHFMLAFWADLCRSGVKVNLCGFWLLQPSPPPFWVCALVSMGSGEHFTLNFFSVTVPVGGYMQKWFPFAGLLWIPVADLEKMRGGGGGSAQKFFSALCLDPPLDTSLLWVGSSGSRPTFKEPVPKLVTIGDEFNW